VQWEFLPLWAALTAAIAWNRSAVGLYAAAASLSVWLVMIGVTLSSHPFTAVAATGAVLAGVSAAVVVVAENELARRIAARAIPFAIAVCFGGLFGQPDDGARAIVIEIVLAIGAGAAAGYVMLTRKYAKVQPIVPLLFAYALGVAFYGLAVEQFHRHLSLHTVVMAAGLTFVILAGALICGIQARSRSIMWLAYAGLVTETLWLYLDKLGNLINTSLFFLIAGAAMFGLARVLMRYGGAERETEVRP
jgi:uncharacterized membrane protein